MIQSPHTLKPFCQTPKTWRFGQTNLGLHSHLPPCETIDDGRLSNLRYSWPTNPTTTWEWKKTATYFYLPLRRLEMPGCSFAVALDFVFKTSGSDLFMCCIYFWARCHAPTLWNDKIIWGQHVGEANPQLQGDHHRCIQNQQIKWATKKKRPYFPWNPSCLIGILIMVYYNRHITG